MSSSEKSISTSRWARIAMTCARSSATRAESAPESCSSAIASAQSLRAATISATASASARSMRPFKNARRVNSPRSANRAPASSGERHDAADNEWTAVALDFGYVLAGQAGRMRHHDRERAIDAGAGGGIDDVAQSASCGARVRRDAAGRKIASRISNARGPEMRTIATAPIPGAVAGATMVSAAYIGGT